MISRILERMGLAAPQAPAKSAALAPRFFAPNYDFECKELNSQYCKDLIYTIRPGNEKLAALADGLWIKRGMIRFVQAHPNAAKVAALSAAGGRVAGTLKIGV